MLSFVVSCLGGVANFASWFISPSNQGAARAWLYGYHGALTTLNATTVEGVAALGRTARTVRQWYQQLRSEVRNRRIQLNTKELEKEEESTE